MPLDLGSDPSRYFPTGCLIPKAMIQDNRLLRWATHRSSQHVFNLTVQNLITFQADGIEISLRFEIAIHLGISKGCIDTEESEDVITSITIDNRLQQTSPVIGTMDIPMAKKCSLQVTILIEAEQGVITGALEVAIVVRASPSRAYFSHVS